MKRLSPNDIAVVYTIAQGKTENKVLGSKELFDRWVERLIGRGVLARREGKVVVTDEGRAAWERKMGVPLGVEMFAALKKPAVMEPIGERCDEDVTSEDLSSKVPQGSVLSSDEVVDVSSGEYTLFDVDDNTVVWSGSLEDFLNANRDTLNEDDIAAYRAMRPGDSIRSGGGAVPVFELRRGGVGGVREPSGLEESTIKLFDWSVFQDDDPYVAPELSGIRLYGRREDGSWVKTFVVDTVNGRAVRTKSGSLYEIVGDPKPEYLAWMKQQGIVYDPDQPIHMKTNHKCDGSCQHNKEGVGSVPEWIRICRDPTQYPLLNTPVRSSVDAYELLKARATAEEQECFYVIMLDNQHQPLGIQEVSRGTINSSDVHQRDVFRTAVLYGATKVIVAHNHPSGTLRPSKHDVEFTKTLVRCGQLLGVVVFDSLIISQKGYYSMWDHKLVRFFGSVRGDASSVSSLRVK